MLAAVLCAQETKLDAKSRELIEQADAALAKASAISLVQTQRVVFGVTTGAALYEMRGPEVSIRAQRPDRFRTEQDGKTDERTVSTGTEWIRYIEKGNAYQKTDVSRYKPAQLFRPPNPLSMLRTRRGLVSLWLGGHSLRALFPTGEGSYDGVKKLHGVRAHRITIRSAPIAYQLYLSTTEPVLPVFLVGTGKDDSIDNPRQVRIELGFTDWRLDPQLPENAFVFRPPKGAAETSDLIDMEETTAVDRLASSLTETPPEPAKEVRPAPPGKPFPTGPNAVTHPMFLDDIRKRYVAFLKEQYMAHGHHDPKWDQEMLKLYEGWAQRLMGDESLKLLIDLREQAYYIRSLGCHDPLLTYRLANFTHFLEGSTASQPMWAPAWKVLGESEYPASEKLPALRGYIESIGKAREGNRDLLNELNARRASLFAQATTEPAFSDDGQRLACYLLGMDWGKMSSALKGQAVAQMQALPNADPWLKAYYTGYYHRITAWDDATGTHLPLARQELTKAWKLHPEFPEAPTEMIVVSSMGGAEESPRVWFDRAISGQIDWGNAFGRIKWAYDSMRGGDPHWLYRLGLDAARSKRFDSYAPHYYWMELQEMRNYIGSWETILRLPGALDTLNMVCDGYVERDSEEYPAEYWESVRLFAYWGVKDYAAANRILQRLHGHLDYAAFEEIYVDPDRVIQETEVFGGPEGESILAALKMIEERQAERAVPILRQAMLALRETSPRDCCFVGQIICSIRFAAAPGAADQILDTIIDMRRREVLIQSYRHWQEEGEEDIPVAFQDRVAAYLGPISWAFMQEAPVDRTIPNDEIEARMARIRAMQPGDIPGIEEIPPDEATAHFETEKRLALLRLCYCWKPAPGRQRWNRAWRYSKTVVAPLAKNFPRYGVLLEFLTEHNDWHWHQYDDEQVRAIKIMTHVQEIDNWEQWRGYRFLPQVAELSQIDDPEAQVEAAWQLYWQRGAPLIGFRIARALAQSGNPGQAALMERHLLTYLTNYRQGPCRTNDGTFVLVVSMNAAPGYEEQLLGQAKKKHGDSYQCKIRLIAADAHIRLGELDEAIEALVKSKADTSRMNEWCYVADGRHRGASDCLNALIQAIVQHPDVTPKTLRTLEILFPGRLAEAQGQ
jgi:hypothetical protein